MPTLTFTRFCWVVVVPFSLLLAALIVFCPIIAGIITVLAVGATVKVMGN